MGAESITEDALALVPGAVRGAIEASGVEAIAAPERELVITGAGPAAITARRGRAEAPRGRADARRGLRRGAPAPRLGGAAIVATPVALTSPDPDGFVDAVSAAAASEGIPTYEIQEPRRCPPLLAQIPLTVRLQVLALRFALERGQDPDTVITGNWADEGLWAIGRPDR